MSRPSSHWRAEAWMVLVETLLGRQVSYHLAQTLGQVHHLHLGPGRVGMERRVGERKVSSTPRQAPALSRGA